MKQMDELELRGKKAIVSSDRPLRERLKNVDGPMVGVDPWQSNRFG